ncbi:uncharacterized protein LOC131942939 [Physella acuta]|uniref:uncharacterized protein LOC131942939 n=1 Tax=Physella acuta TaxID=109671 RepID=UPI0027DE905B|nr:uncharacterized protein LOC131942939 [Physella acuta]
MAIFGRSLADDSIVHYSHTWTALLFLLLALFTWVLPLFLPSGHHSGEATDTMSVHCYAPAQFTNEQVAYTNAICGAAYKKAVSPANVNNSDSTSAAILYKLKTNDESQISRDQTRFGAKDEPPQNSSDSARVVDSQGESLRYLTSHIPVLLFVFAVCLKLTQVLWGMYSRCCGVNVQKTLENVHKISTAPSEPRAKLMEGVWGSHVPSCWTTVGFLVYRLALCSVSVCQLAFIYCYLQPEVGHLGSHSTSSHQDYYDTPLMCKFSLIRLGRTEAYAIQCVFTQSPAQPELTYDTTYAIYVSLSAALVFVLASLSILNIANLITWLLRLWSRPCRRHVSRQDNLATDVYLILFLARDNFGQQTATELADSYQRGTESLGDGSMELKTAEA